MERVIRVRDLTKQYRRSVRRPGLAGAVLGVLRPRHESVDAIRDVSFDVAAGEKIAFIGPNGAGKSTTIKVLTGILHPTAGEATVLGLVPWRDRPVLVSRLGCVFGQRSQLWYHLPVLETFQLLARVYDLSPAAARERLDELVELFELEPLLALPVRKLSLGQRMRAEIAASLLHRPEVVFLDEPTIGLDVVARTRIRDLLLRLNREDGVTLFLTSHDAGDIEEVCERVLLIDGGSIVLDTSVSGLKAEHLGIKRVEAVIAEDTAVVRLPGVELLPAERHRIALRVDTARTPVDRVVQALVKEARVLDLTISGPRLETVIASLYEGGER